jgi:hypothetical protein
MKDTREKGRMKDTKENNDTIKGESRRKRINKN